jgi:hypothetical protein
MVLLLCTSVAAQAQCTDSYALFVNTRGSTHQSACNVVVVVMKVWRWTKTKAFTITFVARPPATALPATAPTDQRPLLGPLLLFGTILECLPLVTGLFNLVAVCVCLSESS